MPFSSLRIAPNSNDHRHAIKQSANKCGSTLQDTRIGKYINDMRKQTSDKNLAKRAKNLVKKWQELYQKTLKPPPTPQDKPPNAQPTYNGKKLSPKTALPQYLVQSTSAKPASPLSRPSTPGSNTSSPGLQRLNVSSSYASKLSPAGASMHQTSTSAVAFKPISPALQPTKSARSDSPLCLGRTNSPFDIIRSHNGHDERSTTPVGRESPAPGFSHKRKRPDDDETRSSPISKRQRNDMLQSSGVKSSTVINGHIDSYSASSSPIENKSTPAESGRLKKSKTSLELKTYQRTPSSASSSLSESLPKTPSIKTPRVKTTAQLLEDLASAGSLNLKGSEAMRKITMNEIDKEHIEDVSVVPAGAKPRQKRKRQVDPPTSKTALHETKRELVHQFLESADPAPPTPDIDIGTSGSHFATDSVVTASSSFTNNGVLADTKTGLSHSSINGLRPDNANNDKNQHLDDGGTSPDQRRVSPVRIKLGARLAGSGNSSELSASVAASSATIIPKAGGSTQEDLLRAANTDPWSLLPELDPDAIQWDCLDYEPTSERPAVTSSVIERLHNDQWSAVNGQYDRFGDWRSWTQCMTSASYNGDSLHILPYVVVEGLNGDVAESESKDTVMNTNHTEVSIDVDNRAAASDTI